MALGHLGDRLDVVDDAGGGLAERRERDLDALVLGQQPVDRGRIQARAPARLVADLVGAVGLAEPDPALAELAGGAHEDPVTGAHEVRERRLHRTRAARGEREHVVLRAEDGRQLGQHALVHLVEGGRAVVEHRRGHRLRDGGRDGRRPGGHQVLLGERIGRHAGRPSTRGEVRRRLVRRLRRFSLPGGSRGRAAGPRGRSPRSTGRSRRPRRSDRSGRRRCRG